LAAIEEIAKENNCSLIFDDIPGRAKGFYSPIENKIVIKKDMPDLQTIKTAVHELAHSIMHQKIELVPGAKEKAEIQAESTAYVVLNKYGLDTSDYSFKYIATWSTGKTEKELEEILETIKDTSQEIIEKIDINIEKEKEYIQDN